MAIGGGVATHRLSVPHDIGNILNTDRAVMHTANLGVTDFIEVSCHG